MKLNKYLCLAHRIPNQGTLEQRIVWHTIHQNMALPERFQFS